MATGRSDFMTDKIKCRVCDNENRTREVEHYCRHCRDYCSSCTDMHKRCPSLTRHRQQNRVDIWPQGLGGSLRSDHTQECLQHQLKVKNSFYTDHDETTCPSCILSLANRSCQQTVCICDEICNFHHTKYLDNVQQRISKTKKSMEEIKATKEKQIRKLKSDLDQEVKSIKTFRQELNTILDDMEVRTLQELIREFSKIEEFLSGDVREAETMWSSLNDAALQLEMSGGNKLQESDCIKWSQKLTAKGAAMTRKQQKTIDQSVAFIHSVTIKRYLQNMSALGVINIPKSDDSDDDIFGIEKEIQAATKAFMPKTENLMNRSKRYLSNAKEKRGLFYDNEDDSNLFLSKKEITNSNKVSNPQKYTGTSEDRYSSEKKPLSQLFADEGDDDIFNSATTDPDSKPKSQIRNVQKQKLLFEDVDDEDELFGSHKEIQASSIFTIPKHENQAPTSKNSLSNKHVSIVTGLFEVDDEEDSLFGSELKVTALGDIYFPKPENQTNTGLSKSRYSNAKKQVVSALFADDGEDDDDNQFDSKKEIPDSCDVSTSNSETAKDSFSNVNQGTGLSGNAGDDYFCGSEKEILASGMTATKSTICQENQQTELIAEDAGNYFITSTLENDIPASDMVVTQSLRSQQNQETELFADDTNDFCDSRKEIPAFISCSQDSLSKQNIETGLFEDEDVGNLSGSEKENPSSTHSLNCQNQEKGLSADNYSEKQIIALSTANNMAYNMLPGDNTSNVNQGTEISADDAQEMNASG